MRRKIASIAGMAAIAGVLTALPAKPSPGPIPAAARLAGRTTGSAVRPVLVQEIRESHAASVWPLPSAFEWYWHKPDESLSQSRIDSSLAGIKAGRFLSVMNKWAGPLTGVSVNRKRIKFEYQAGAGRREVNIALDLLGSMRMYYASNDPQGQKWLVVVTLASESSYRISFETEVNARSFIDAVASSCRAAGIELEDKDRRGFFVSDLTPSQIQALGKGRLESALVTLIAYGGPAETAGIRFLDLITEVDGVKVRNADHLVSILDAAAPGATLALTCLERKEETEGGAASFVWKPRTVLFRTGA